MKVAPSDGSPVALRTWTGQRARASRGRPRSSRSASGATFVRVTNVPNAIPSTLPRAGRYGASCEMWRANCSDSRDYPARFSRPVTSVRIWRASSIPIASTAAT